MRSFGQDIKDLLLCLAVVTAALLLPGDPLSAARNQSLVSPVANPYELVVIEVEGCAYCPILRRDAIPVFEASPQAKEISVRFLDLNTPAAQSLTLTEGPLTVVPTLLLVKDNREVGRAAGYMGPDGFVFAAKWLIQNAR